MSLTVKAKAVKENTVGKNYKDTTNEELLDMLITLSIKIGKTPTSSIMHNSNTKLPDIRVYTRRFGSWANALRLAGFKDVVNSYKFNEKCLDLINILEDKNDSNLSWKSDKKVWVICSFCNYRQIKRIRILSKFGFRCIKCGDSKSKPEKIISSILTQLNISFEVEKIFNWSQNKRYDFYIPELSCIIETHGEQHYKEIPFYSNRTLVEEKENDILKREMAIKNGILYYIIINCSNPVIEELVNEILGNKDLRCLFDLDEVDYEKTCIESLSNTRYKLVENCCNLYNLNKTIPEITKELKLNNSAVTRYLILGSSLNMCNYNRKYAWDKRRLREEFGCKSKQVYCKEIDKKYDSAKIAFVEIKKISKDKFVYSNFCECCRGLKNNCYKGFHVYYIDKEIQNVKSKIRTF